MWGLTIALCALLVGGCVKNNQSSETVYKVEDVGGVPRLTINGEPVRSRMLYVSPTYFMLETPTKVFAPNNGGWLNTFIDIPAMESSIKNGVVELAPDVESFECFISKLVVVDVESGKNVWELDVKSPQKQTSFRMGVDKGSIATEVLNKNGKSIPTVALKSTEKSVLSFGGVNLDKGKKYRIDIAIKSKNKKLPFDLYLAKDGKLVEPKLRSMVGLQTKLAKDAGVDIITFPVQAADFMKEDGSADYENLKGALEEIIKANPNVKILVRIRFYPPQWWIEKYPEDVMKDNTGKTLSEDKKVPFTFPCLSSKQFRKDAVKVLETIIDFCEENYGKNIIGFQPGGGTSCEWYYCNTWNVETYGYNKSSTDAWKRWVEKKYKTNEQLRAAWNDQSATFSNISVPSHEERSNPTYIIDLKTQQKLIDYNTFLQDEMVDMVETLGKVIRRKAPNKLSAIFYGYTFEHSAMPRKGLPATGHCALWKVANSPYFDMICGPISYFRRDLGQSGSTLAPSETVTRCGKIWFDEDDVRTHRVPQSHRSITAFGEELKNCEDTMNVLQRDLARQAIRNHSCWWMDLAGTGWFDDPKMWRLMPDFDKLEKDMMKYPVEYNPEVAVVLDERSALYLSGGNVTPHTTKLTYLSRTLLASCAIPYGQYLMQDFLFGKNINPKLAIFTMNYATTAQERKILREKTKDIAALFVWIPSYIDLDKRELSTTATKEATGFDVEPIKDNISAKLKTTTEGKKIGLPDNFGFDAKVRPLLSPITKSGDVVLATYENGKPAVVKRGKHIFCAVADIPKELYKHAIDISGAHVYAKSEQAVWASGGYVSITCTDGIKELHDVEMTIPSNKEIFDAVSGEKLGKAPKLILKMKRGDNRILRLGKGNKEYSKK